MSNYLEIHLFNFQKWNDRVIRLLPGTTLFNGKSGSGKSTFCRAIHFCLYGGKKWKKINTKGTKIKKTFVRFTHVKPDGYFTIIRERPSESINVEYCVNGQISNLISNSAQSWINSNFGTEDIWICSSYLIQDKPHFFLRESNANKKELLRQLTFGDIEGSINPDYFTTSLASSCVSIRSQIDGISGELKTRSFLADDIVSKTPDIFKFGSFTPEIIYKIEQELYMLHQEKTKLEIQLHDNNLRVNVENELNILRHKANELDLVELENNLIKFQEIIKLVNLKRMLTGFDIRVLTIDIDQLKRNEFLYNSYIRAGFDQNDKTKTIEEFIKIKKDQSEKYKRFLRLDKENEEIERQNLCIRETNKSLTRSYEIRKSQYDRKIKEIELYEKQKDDLTSRRSIINETQFILFDETDDSSSSFVRNVIAYCEIANKELTCPHCLKGVVYENSRLQKGCLFSDDMRITNNQRLELAKLELGRRELKEQYIHDANEFSKIPTPQVPEVIDEPNFQTEKEKIKYVKVEPCNLDFFDVPNIKYEDMVSMISSIPLIESYNQLTNSELKDSTIDPNQITKTQNDITSQKYILNKIQFEEERLSKMQPFDPDVLSKLEFITNKINSSIKQIEIGKQFLIFISHKEAIQFLTNKHYELASYIEKFEALSRFIVSVANSSINDVIASINDSLDVICTDLFDSPISLLLSCTKELKNKNEVNTVNLEINYNGNIYDDPDELSGGELRRVYLALVLAFSRINTSPIIILDESLHSIDPSTKELCLEKIKEWTPNKFIIHVCHDISEGHHDNLISF
jgi:energy-coupling factor transporter ATP-binding protein EcfA2